MSSPSPVVHPGRPDVSRHAVLPGLTIFEADDSMSRDLFGNNSKVPMNAEDQSTLTERVLTFLDKHSA